jgi:hypothetical protein
MSICPKVTHPGSNPVLNDYLAYLPTVKDSSMAVEDRNKGNVPFSKADLVGIVLKAVPTSWINQYNLTHLTPPKSPRLLLLDLENIERLTNKKRTESAKAKGKDGPAFAWGLRQGAGKREFPSHFFADSFLAGEKKKRKTLGPWVAWPPHQILQVLHIFSELKKRRGMCVRGSPHYSEFCLRQTPNHLSHRFAWNSVAGNDIDCREK